MLHLVVKRREPLEPAQRIDHLATAVDVAAEQRLKVIEVLRPRRSAGMRLEPTVQVGDEPLEPADVGDPLAHPVGLVTVTAQVLLQRREPRRPLVSALPMIPAWRDTESQRAAGMPPYSSRSSFGNRASVMKSITDRRERSVSYRSSSASV